MTFMLASVTNLTEARLAAASGVDIIDFKNPNQGALGALPVSEIEQIVTVIQNEANVQGHDPAFSATIGDLPLQADIVIPAVQAMADCGVDYVKIGFFPGSDPDAVLDGLAPIAEEGTALIAVLFADHPLDFTLMPRLQAAGFQGVMLDTHDKSRGSLTTRLDRETLKHFIQAANEAELLTGLAGSLCLEDIPTLLPLQPDYLGFRGALCVDSSRTATLDIERIQAIRAAVPE